METPRGEEEERVGEIWPSEGKIGRHRCWCEGVMGLSHSMFNSKS
jgi:hypothetical protein